jgi:aminoglycoside phosphotransferase (APT) family kinase protein
MNDAADLEHHPAVLARLHAQLHEIPFQDPTLLHRDLHPENVILSPARADPNVTDDERAHLLSIRNH